MSNLMYKTRGNTDSKGKQRVYFCCHPEDFEKYFDVVSNEILSKQNCAIWYVKRDFERTEEFLTDLKQMQLFVMPVTSNLLCSDNNALNVDFKFAMDNHIPVLPLLQERELEQLFNLKCGNLQFLDKTDLDITTISYEEKLEKYLCSVLIGDELAEKIRSAFDAYVFLSYRKKDRKHAQELMRLIHKNDFCRDIAIWYDEFLIPGENFNTSIEEAIKKSGVFILAVTPNLVNETNYIMTTEYPMAKREGKPILPIELIVTDWKQLYEKYENIPQPASVHNEIEFSASLLETIKEIAITETDSSPEHDFFIGLAYLNGIDVEVDTEKAINLIEHAANRGLVEAAEKLVHIYSLGQGVKRDTEKAVRWQEGLLHYFFNKAEGNCYVVIEDKEGIAYAKYKKPDIKMEQLDIDLIIAIATNMNKLFEMYSTCGPLRGFDNYGNEFSGHATFTYFWNLEKSVPHTAQTLSIIARRYDLWGEYYTNLGNHYDEAISNIKKGYKLKRKFCTSEQLIYERQKYRLKIIKLMIALGKYNKVYFICKKALLTAHYYKLAYKTDFRIFIAEYQYFLAYSLFRNGKIKYSDAATKHLNIANKVCHGLHMEGQKTDSLRCNIYEMLGMISEVNNECAIANKKYAMAYEYSKKSMAISAEKSLVLRHIQICKSLAIMCLYKKDNGIFEKYLDEINECFDNLDRCEYKSLLYYNELAEFYYLKGLYTKKEQLIENSIQLYENLRETAIKSKKCVWVNCPSKRFGKDITRLFE